MRTVGRRLDCPPPSPRTQSCWAPVPAAAAGWGRAVAARLYIRWRAGVGQGGKRRLRAVGCQDQLPSSARCLATQSCTHSPPAHPRRALLLLQGLSGPPPHPCWAPLPPLSPGNTNGPPSVGSETWGRGHRPGWVGEVGREGRLQGSPLLANRNTGYFSVASRTLSHCGSQRTDSTHP